jgi:signal transduction histidine kinase
MLSLRLEWIIVATILSFEQQNSQRETPGKEQSSELRQELRRYRQLAERLQRERHELTVLLTMTRGLFSTLHPEILASLILKYLEDITDFAAANVMLFEQEDVWIQAYASSANEVLPSRQFPITQFPLLGRIGDTLQILRIADVSKDERLTGTMLELIGCAPSCHAWLSIPLIFDGRLIGAINLFHQQPNYYTLESLYLLQTFADQAACALEYTHHYRQACATAAEAERQRLARGLHDTVVQSLYSADLVAEALPEVWEHFPDKAHRGLDELRRLSRRALTETRALLLEMRPTALIDKPLSAVLTHLTESFTNQTRTPVWLTQEGDGFLPSDLQLALYYIVREALNNIAKHAQATEVSLMLRYAAEGGHIAIQDNGCGFERDRVSVNGFGLGIMADSAEDVGATFAISSTPGQGTEITVDWRLAAVTG